MTVKSQKDEVNSQKGDVKRCDVNDDSKRFYNILWKLIVSYFDSG